MLKIKDNVDLKVLEKYGFKNLTKEYNGKIISFWSWSSGEITINFWERTTKREICLNVSPVRKSYDILFDLIKADLVEKVVE